MKSKTALLTGAAVLLLGGFCTSGYAQTSYERLPNNAFQLRLGYFMPGGEGALWEDVEQRFTLGVDDFNSGVWGLSFVSGLTNHVELGVHGDWYEQTVVAEEQYYFGDDGYPIVHDTTLRQVPLAVDLRIVPAGRYRNRGRDAVPMTPVFYLGAGVGVNIWEYEEIGDFVDEGDPTLPIYFGEFKESGESLEGRVLAGLEFPVSAAFNLMFEGRYTWSQVELKGPLADLGELDRGGLWFFAGASFRF